MNDRFILARRAAARHLARSAFAVSIAGPALLAGPGTANADGDYPHRPVRVVVPFPAGTSPDVVARAWAERMSQAMGQQFVIDNRPGAATIIGTQAVATAPADGYTLLYTAQNTVSINPFVYKTLPYKADDFVPVSLVAEVPLVLITAANSPVRSLTELIQMAKQAPGKYTFASYGIGQGTHVTMERLANSAGIRMVHVPYKDGGMSDVISGTVNFSFDASTTAIPQIQAGKLHALAVSSARRLDTLPNVPAVNETIAGFTGDSWTGLLVRKGTPHNIIQKLSAESLKVIATEPFQKRLRDVGLRPGSGSPEDFARFIANESAIWSKVVRDNNISVE